MDEDKALERYRQRYETWRHLDGLRYRTIEFVVIGIGLFSGLAGNGTIRITSVVAIVIGLLLLSQWKLLRKIDDGIANNGDALREFAAEIGDARIPLVSKRYQSVFYWFEVLIFFIGIGFLGWGVISSILEIGK